MISLWSLCKGMGMKDPPPLPSRLCSSLCKGFGSDVSPPPPPSFPVLLSHHPPSGIVDLKFLSRTFSDGKYIQALFFTSQRIGWRGQGHFQLIIWKRMSRRFRLCCSVCKGLEAVLLFSLGKVGLSPPFLKQGHAVVVDCLVYIVLFSALKLIFCTCMWF